MRALFIFLEKLYNCAYKCSKEGILIYFVSLDLAVVEREDFYFEKSYGRSKKRILILSSCGCSFSYSKYGSFILKSNMAVVITEVKRELLFIYLLFLIAVVSVAVKTLVLKSCSSVVECGSEAGRRFRLCRGK